MRRVFQEPYGSGYRKINCEFLRMKQLFLQKNNIVLNARFGGWNRKLEQKASSNVGGVTRNFDPAKFGFAIMYCEVMRRRLAQRQAPDRAVIPCVQILELVSHKESVAEIQLGGKFAPTIQ
jgi:hypothetical protein